MCISLFAKAFCKGNCIGIRKRIDKDIRFERRVKLETNELKSIVLNQIGRFIYNNIVEIEGWQCREAIYEGPDQYTYLTDWVPFSIGSVWDNGGKTLFFKANFHVPQRLKGEKIYMNLVVGGEALVYINGSPHNGLDINRNLIRLKEQNQDGPIEVLIEATKDWLQATLSKWSSSEYKEHVFSKANLVIIDDEIYNFYYDALVAVDTLQVMDESETKRKVKQVIQGSFKIIKSFRDKDKLNEYIESAHKFLKEGLANVPEDCVYPQLACIGQSHIDVAWMWPYRETIRKCSRTFSTAVNLMEEYPNFTFTQSQAQLYEYMKLHYPEIYNRVREKVKEGKWEVEGGMWVEPDCNLISGESFVRQFLYGKRFFKEEFGVDCKICWLPDTFGYSASMPQILKKCGIEYFMTIKVYWNDTNRFPFVTFKWKGIDGTELLSHCPAGLNTPFAPSHIVESTRFLSKGIMSDEVMYLYGWGDGGGGVTREMLETEKRLRNFPGINRCISSKAVDFFKRLEMKSQTYPTWHGELYLEKHRGTYTTHADNKKNNRKQEFLYRDAEILSSISMLIGEDFTYPDLEKGWRMLLLEQFHDVLPGTSISEVHEDSRNNYEKIAIIGSEAKNKASVLLSNIIDTSGSKESLIVYNTLSWDRQDIARAVINCKDFIIQDNEGNEITYQIITDEPGRKEIIFCAKTPSLGYSVYNISPGKGSVRPVNSSTAAERQFENSFYKIELSMDGTLTRVYDKINHREVISKDKRGNVFQIFNDADPGDAWDIRPSYQENMEEIDEVVSIEVIEIGSIRTVVRIVKRYNNSVFTQDMILYEDIPRIDFDTFVDWQEDLKMVKVAFSVDIVVDKATFDIAYGNIQRSTHNNTSWEQAQFEVSAHKWADLSEQGFGVSLMNDCKYGYDIKNGIIRLTLLRSTVFPDKNADRGTHSFVYSLYTHSGDWRVGNTAKRAYELNVPLVVKSESEHEGLLPKKGSFFSISCDNVMLETLKKAEEGNELVVRVYEYMGIQSEVELESLFSIKEAVECNLMEETEGPIEAFDNSLKFKIKPYEIKTFRVLVKD
jgi:alpha-mannosidase